MFVCDRTELRDQATLAFQNVFGNDAQPVATGNARKNARILIATYQTLDVDTEDAEANFFLKHYPQNYFSHVAIDECHRSAWGKWSIVLTHNPDAVQIGLTATPRQLKVKADTPEQKEDAQITADNLAYFGEPVYEYDMGQAIKDGYLAACEIQKGRVNVDDTGITIEEVIARGPKDAITGEPAPAEEIRELYEKTSYEHWIVLPDRVMAMTQDLFNYLLETEACAGYDEATVEVKGWNLPADELTLDAKDKEPGILPVSVRREELVSNRVPFALDTLPECLEQEANNQQTSAQRVTLPVIVNGRIDQPGDSDVFCFEGSAGDEIVAEVYARRLDSPLDSVLKLTNIAGRKLLANDDHEDKGAGLITHHADSLLSTTLPANGTYYVYLGDAQNKGGAAYGYRLRISPPRPDFELRVVPSSVNARAGATVGLTVYALRKDGFSDEIALSLKDAPNGFALSGGRVPAQQDQVRLTLRVPPTPTKEPVSLRLEGRAVIQGREIARLAVPADDMMQAFIYRHLVPAKDLKVAVVGRAKPKAPAKNRSPQDVKAPPAKQAKSK